MAGPDRFNCPIVKRRSSRASLTLRFFSPTKYRMLEVDIMADRASVLHLLVLSKPLSGYLQMWRYQLDSRAWVAKRTAQVLKRGAAAVPGGFVDVEEVCLGDGVLGEH